jgi:hypothetical protein
MKKYLTFLRYLRYTTFCSALFLIGLIISIAIFRPPAKLSHLKSEGWKELATIHSDSTILMIRISNLTGETTVLIGNYFFENNKTHQYLVLADYSFSKIEEKNIIYANVTEITKSILNFSDKDTTNNI